MSDAADITVLIADDAPDIVRTVQARVKHAGFATITADNGKSALDALLGTTGIDADGKTPDIALIDINMPGMSGLEVLQAARVERPNLPVIVMTADITVPRVVEAMRGGAYDFLPKPIDPNVLQVTLRQASEHVRLQRRVSQLQEELGIYEGRVVAESAGMKRAMRLLRQAVDSNATVLLLGESGTGKGLLARELHRTGPRANGPFIAVNCAAIPDTLLESELFGHEKGAFTGATSRRIGKFEAANGGVLFLDEIGDMPLALQAKLLRVLQDREVERLGSNEPIRLDVRVVAATNVDLEQRIEQNEFREDLYYRLAVLEVFIPPLRERLDDVQPLAAGVVTRAAKDEGRKVTGMSPALIEALQEFDWPGNIRQLENVLTRAVIVAEGEILQRDDLPPAMLKRLRKLREASDVGKAGPEESGDQLTLLPILGFDNEDDIPTLADLDVAVMKRALEVCGGNVTRAAKQLGIGRATLYRRLYADRGQVDDGSDDDSNPSAGD